MSFTKFSKSCERAITAAALDVRHERWPVGGGKHRVRAADLHAARGIAGVLGELARRRAAHEFAREAAGHMHAAGIADRSTGTLPQAERDRVAADFHADLFEQLIGMRLDREESFFSQKLIGGQAAGDESGRVRRLRTPRLARLAGARTGAPRGRGIRIAHAPAAW